MILVLYRSHYALRPIKYFVFNTKYFVFACSLYFIVSEETTVKVVGNDSSPEVTEKDTKLPPNEANMIVGEFTFQVPYMKRETRSATS